MFPDEIWFELARLEGIQGPPWCRFFVSLDESTPGEIHRGEKENPRRRLRGLSRPALPQIPQS